MHVKNGWLSRATHGWRVNSVGAFTGHGHDYRSRCSPRTTRRCATASPRSRPPPARSTTSDPLSPRGRRVCGTLPYVGRGGAAGRIRRSRYSAKDRAPRLACHSPIGSVLGPRHRVPRQSSGVPPGGTSRRAVAANALGLSRGWGSGDPSGVRRGPESTLRLGALLVRPIRVCTCRPATARRNSALRDCQPDRVVLRGARDRTATDPAARLGHVRPGVECAAGGVRP